MDPGSHPEIVNPDSDFQAVGPAMRILQLNVEAVSVAKRGIISLIAEQKVDIICPQETHVNDDETNMPFQHQSL